MRRVTGLIAVLVLSAPSIGASAQKRPDFTGSWMIAMELSSIRPIGLLGRRSVPGVSFSAVQTDKTLTIVRTSAPASEEKTTTYNLDGTVTRHPIAIDGFSIDRTSRAKWDGNTLVVATVSTFNGALIEWTHSWSLDASGHLVVESASKVDGDSQPSKATYQRR